MKFGSVFCLYPAVETM